MKAEELKTQRLILRKLSPEIYDHIFSQLSDQELLVYLGLKSMTELEVEKNKYEQGLWTHNKKFINFQLLRHESKKVIGWCGFHTWYLEHKRAEIGYGLFDEDAKRKGLMTEALYPIVEYGFKKMNLNRIEAFIGPENKASIKLVHNLNFVKEGQLREHYAHDGRIEDSIVFSLLKREFEAKEVLR